ncbi:MAG: hypothetical protein CK530_07420 [Planctomycetaceae bacterium]|nr:MAG: hypothetical protein CK530_07420 [Planctomycetaceae bacterium]
MASLDETSLREVVIVDPACDRYADFVQAAQASQIGLHFCSDGRAAVRMSRRFRADIWLVNSDLPDMSGFDLLDLLSMHVSQGAVDPMRSGTRVSLDQVGRGMQSGIFIVSDAYRLFEEQQALASGIAGYLVHPINLDVIRAAREPIVPLFGSQLIG